MIDRGEESGGDEKAKRLRCTSRVIWAFDLVVGFHCRHHVQPVQAGRINTRSHQRARTRRTQRAILGSSVGAVAAEKSSAWSTSTSTSTIWSQHNTSPQLLTLPLHTSPVSCFPFHPHTRLPLIPTRVILHLIHQHRSSIVSEERLASRRLGAPATPYLPRALASGPNTPPSYSSPLASHSSNKDTIITVTAPRATASRHIIRGYTLDRADLRTNRSHD